MAVMIFVNDLDSVHGLSKWTYHMPANVDAMTYVDMVFPAFLFIVGMALPIAVKQRLKRNASVASLWMHVVLRSIALLVLGLILANAGTRRPGADAHQPQCVGAPRARRRHPALECLQRPEQQNCFAPASVAALRSSSPCSPSFADRLRMAKHGSSFRIRRSSASSASRTSPSACFTFPRAAGVGHRIVWFVLLVAFNACVCPQMAAL